MKKLLALSTILAGCQPVIIPEVHEQETVFVGYKSDSAFTQKELPSGVILEDDGDGKSSGVYVELPAEEPPGKQVSINPVSDFISFVAMLPSKGDPTVVSIEVSADAKVARVEYFLPGQDGQPDAFLGQSSSAGLGFPLSAKIGHSGPAFIGARAFGSDGLKLATAFKGYAGEEGLAEGISDIQFLEVGEGKKISNPAIFSVGTHGPIHSVRYLCDGLVEETKWTLGESFEMESGFGLSFHFIAPGSRTIYAEALDAFGEVLAVDVVTVHVEVDGGTSTFVQQGNCPIGQSLDCTGTCVDARHLGDGYCDNGGAYLFDFACELFGFDDGDCDTSLDVSEPLLAESNPQETESGCQEGTTEDCDGNCSILTWIGDGTCDDGTGLVGNFNCAAFQFDGGDCVGGIGRTSDEEEVPYFYQKSNGLYPTTSGPVTALAMLLGYAGWEGVPDDILGLYGNDFEDIDSLRDLFNEIAALSDLEAKVTDVQEGSITEVRSLLSSGMPLLILGKFAEFPHALVALEHSNGLYRVHDPLGKWSEKFEGGYPYGWDSSIGEEIEYGDEALDLAISTNNGYNAAPIRYLVLQTE